jgi:hypothetical protein
MKIDEFNKKEIRYIVLNPTSSEDNLGLINNNRLTSYFFKDNQISKLNSTVLTFKIFSKEKKYEMRGGNKTNKYEFYIREDGSLDTNPIYE